MGHLGLLESVVREDSVRPSGVGLCEAVESPPWQEVGELLLVDGCGEHVAVDQREAGGNVGSVAPPAIPAGWGGGGVGLLGAVAPAVPRATGAPRLTIFAFAQGGAR